MVEPRGHLKRGSFTKKQALGGDKILQSARNRLRANLLTHERCWNVTRGAQH